MEEGVRSERDAWIDQTARQISTVLSGSDDSDANLYTPEQCRELAEALYDLPVSTPPGAMSPESRILEMLLLMQDLEPTTAHVLALALPRLDLTRLIIPSGVAAALMGFSTISLNRHRRAGNFPADIEHRVQGWPVDVSWRLERVLRVLSTDRHRRAMSGPGNVRF